jgi:NAD(P)-dependent dehydrogenase (short-subunit alcohol dehydrogenase family)
MTEQLKGKGAIVTGGASGIGRATALMLVEEGADVFVLDRNEEGGRDVVNEIQDAGGRASYLQVDLADLSTIAPAVSAAIEFLGHIDILVNSAGVRAFDPAKGRARMFDIDQETWDFVFAVNLRAPFFLTQEVSRHMIERGEGGRIVNVSSMAAFQSDNCSIHYSASKAGLGSVTRNTAADLGRHGINVNAVAPGITKTPMSGSLSEDQLRRMTGEGPLANLLGSAAEPEEVASAILFLCLPGSSQITAQTIHTSGGYIAT